MNFDHRCWAHIDLDALRHNFSLVQRTAHGSPVMAVVKADAYGHGDIVVAKALQQAGAAWLAVSCFAEAKRLREGGLMCPVLILGYTDAGHAKELAQYHITQTVYSLVYAQELSAQAVADGVQVQVHIKVDTGMSRIGFAVGEDMDTAVAQMAQVCALPSLDAQGIYTHFAVADSTTPADIAYTERQHTLLQSAEQALAEKGITFACRHACNSAGIIAWQPCYRDVVRAGIVLYGENPSPDVCLPGLQAVMQMKAVVSLVKEVPAHTDVSYGRTFQSDKPMRLATLTIGYADGYPRAMSNQGVVDLHGKRARVVGRVCMDQMMVDVTDIPETQIGDVATVFGGGVADSVTQVATCADTINYEILCNVSRRVPRVYHANGEVVSRVNYLSNEI